MTSEDSRPAYLQVADALRIEIADGRLQPGQRLPSVRELSENHAIAPVTVQNALRVLRDEGLIFSRSTRGYFVREDLDPDELREQPSPEYLVLRQHLDLIQGSVDELTKRLSHLEAVVGGSAVASEGRPPAPEHDVTGPRSAPSA